MSLPAEDTFEARWTWVYETYGYPVWRCAVCEKAIEANTRWYRTAGNEWICDSCYNWLPEKVR